VATTPETWVDLSDGEVPGAGSISGSAASSLSVGRAQGTITLRCVVSDACGSAVSDVAMLTPCAADFNCDGLRNPDDLSEFITCFFLDLAAPGTCIQGDFNGDGARNPDDLSEMITTFFLGC
jgi:hypothetical protein